MQHLCLTVAAVLELSSEGPASLTSSSCVEHLHRVKCITHVGPASRAECPGWLIAPACLPSKSELHVGLS